jgi:hypothetical protein
LPYLSVPSLKYNSENIYVYKWEHQLQRKREIYVDNHAQPLSGMNIITLQKETAPYPEISALTYDPTRYHKNQEKDNINYGLISCVSVMYQFSRWLPSISTTIPTQPEQCYCMMKRP